MDVVRGAAVTPVTPSSGAVSGHGRADSCCRWTMEDWAIVVASYHRCQTLAGHTAVGLWKDAQPLSDLGRTLCLRWILEIEPPPLDLGRPSGR